MAGRGHHEHDTPHGDWWSPLRPPSRRFRRPEEASAELATLAPGASQGSPQPAEGDEDLAELRAVRARLARELSVMDERVDRLAQLREQREHAAAAPMDPERLASVQAKLRRAAEALDDAHRVREAIAGHLVAREHEAVVAAAPVDPGSRPRSLLPLALLAILAALVGVALGATLLGGSDESPAPARSPAPAPRPATVIPPGCADLGAGGGTCITGTTLTIRPQSRAVVLPGLEARVTDVTRTATGVDVRMRLTNTTDQTQSLDRRIYLSLNGQRVYAQTDPIPARTKRTLAPSFPLAAPPPESADLGLVPFGEDVDAPRRLGVIRLTLPPA